MRPRPGRAPALVVALAALAALSGCGYSLAGRGSFLPAYIRTIGVPVLENRTTVFQIEDVLTQRLRAEFIGRGKYKVVPDASGADAVLEGEIVDVSVAPTGFNADRQASRYVVSLVARITFRDVKANAILWENPALQFSEEYEVATSLSGTADAAAFFGQESNALERIGTSFARSVIAQIMEAF
jgi:hypothetical protein